MLANDTDPDGDTLTITAVTQPANGSVVNNGSNVSFTPELNFNGSAEFSYTIDDANGGTDTATVTVTVTAVNDNPVARGDSATTTTGTPVVINLLANDSDDDGETDLANAVVDSLPLGGVLTCGGPTVPPGEVAVVGTVCSGGVMTFTATAADVFTFTYRAQDQAGALSENAATVSVTVTPGGGLVDLDITQFRAGNRVNVGGTVTPSLGVRNNGAVDAQRPATVVGVQGGVQVYNETIQVSDALGGGATTFNFPSFDVAGGGNITWTATIVDDDADVDQATATTRVR